MILILSEDFDPPTRRITLKLEQKKADFTVIYGSDFLTKKILIDVTNKSIIIDNEELGGFNITWYRRWFNRKFKFSDDVNDNYYLKNEFDEYSSNFINYLPTKKWLNNPPYTKAYPSKSLQLKKAREHGLDIPNTIITNYKEGLSEFYNENTESLITKNLSDPLTFKKENEYFATYTSDVTFEDINSQSDEFFPSIFQENIPKTIELRIFYFLGNFYSHAIFSSTNEQTSVDFRVYDYKKPNRKMKYELPNEIKIKINNLMEDLGLHTGSIDIIKSDDRYIFLEVNPQGMFGGLEDYGLNIEEDIANYLIQNDEF